MLNSVAFLQVAALVVGGVPATTQTQPQQPQSAQQQQPATGQAPLDPKRKICKSEELIGSRLGVTRVCKTAAQWSAEHERAQGTDQQ